LQCTAPAENEYLKAGCARSRLIRAGLMPG